MNNNCSKQKNDQEIIFVEQDSDLFINAYKHVERGILGGLLITGLYSMAAPPKVGKSTIGMSLANAVATGTDYLGKPNIKGKVLYFDNDDYLSEASSRFKSLGIQRQPGVTYVFREHASSLKKIKNAINQITDISEYKLVIIDTLIGIEEYRNSDMIYKSDTSIFIDFRDFIMAKNLVCILMNHTKKTVTRGAEAHLGSRGLTSSTTGNITINVEDEMSTVGTMEFSLRHKKEIIPIKKDENGIGWNVMNSEELYEESIDKNVLSIINTVVASERKEIEGTCQEIVLQTRIEINPMGLLRFLKKYEKILKDNHIEFSSKRTNKKRMINIKYTEV